MIQTKRNRYFPGSAILTILAVLLQISCNQPVSSGGSEAGNARVAGMVTTEDGSPAGNVIVTLLPAQYNPVTDAAIPDSCRDTTGSDGTYQFSAEKDQRYSVEAVHKESRLRALVTDVPAATTPADSVECALTAPGTIRILTPEGKKDENAYAYIPGTTNFTRLSLDEGFVILDSVPAGVALHLSYAASDVSSPELLKDNVTVSSGDTTTIPWKNWAYSQTIILNTSGTGADSKEDLHDFPVLITLPAGDATIDQCQPGGEDLRFTTSGGTILPHAIELWDTTSGNAAIWVKIDTLYGDDDQQSIEMLWGNPMAGPAISPEPVFDTANGFEGVWHLSDTDPAAAKDASANQYDGISPNGSLPASRSGQVGNSRTFNGTTDYITMPNTANSRLDFSGSDTFTVSAWVSLDTIDAMPHLVVAKGYAQYFMRCTYFPVDAPLWEFSDFSSVDSWETCTTGVAPRVWTHLTGVREGSRHLLYRNGTLVDSTPSSYLSLGLTRDNSSDVTIGRFMELVTLPNNTSSYCFFRGSIDEVRIESRARSATWIKASYLNQQQNGLLVQFKN